MPKIIISATAYQAIVARSENMQMNSERQETGEWKIKLSFDTIERLKERQLAGESLSQTIERICSTAGKIGGGLQ